MSVWHNFDFALYNWQIEIYEAHTKYCWSIEIIPKKHLKTCYSIQVVPKVYENINRQTPTLISINNQTRKPL